MIKDSPEKLAAHRVHKQHIHMIEGNAVTLAEIGLRLGVSRVTAAYRLKREQAKPGPVTWARLALIGKNAKPPKSHPWKNSPSVPVDRSRPRYVPFTRRGVAE